MSDRLKCPGCGMPTIQDAPGISPEEALCDPCYARAESESQGDTDTGPLDCRDHSCWFATDKGGQRTNGGCRCLREVPIGLRGRIIQSVQAKVAAERERCAKIAESTRIIGGETPGPLYVAGWNAACPQAAQWIRDDSFPRSTSPDGKS